MAPPNQKKKTMVYSSGKKTAARLDSNNSIEWFKSNVPQYRFKVDTKNVFDILPYEARKGNQSCDEGEQHFELTVWVHKGLGSDGRRSVICKAKMKKGNCPICAHVTKHRAEMTEKERTDLLPKHRQIYMIYDRMAEEGTSRFKFLETSYKMGFGEMLANELSAEDESDPVQHLHSLEDGQTLTVLAKNKSYKTDSASGTFIAPVKIKLEPRKKPFNESILEKYPNPEECLVYLDDDEIKKILASGIGGLDDSPTVDDDDDDDDDDTDDENEDDDSSDTDSEESDDEDDDTDDDSDDDSDDDDDDDEDDEPAAKKAQSKAKPASKPAAKDEDEDDDSDDDEDDGSDDEDDEESSDDSNDEDSEDDEDEDDEPATKKQKTAKECGITLGMKVKHSELGVCEVTHISGDGTSLKLKDKSGETHMAQAPEDCTPMKKEEAPAKAKKEEKKPEKKEEKPKKKAAVADDDDEW